MSPLKMFDYLAAKMVIIASDLDVYKHILKNDFNCKLIKMNDDFEWSKTIEGVLKNKKKKDYLKKMPITLLKNILGICVAKKIISFAKI